MDLTCLKAEMNATLIFTVYYGSLPKVLLDELVNNLVFNFGRDDAIQLDTKSLEITLKHKEKDKEFTYTVRKIFKTKIDCDVFWSPFEMVNLVLSITIQSVPFKIANKETGKKVLSGEMKFNLMDHENNYLKASYSEEGRFGNYDLAEALVTAEFSNERVT